MKEKKAKMNCLRKIGSIAVVAVMLTSLVVLLPDETTANGSFEIKPKEVTYGETKSIDVYNATPGKMVILIDSTGATRDSKTTDSGGNVTLTGPPPYIGIYFDIGGNWTVRDVETGNELILKVVSAHQLTVSVTPEEETYSKILGAIPISGTVKDENGNPVTDADVLVQWINATGGNEWPPYTGIKYNTTTDEGGNYSTWVYGLHGVGYYNISAWKNITGGPEYEKFGYAKLPKVVPNEFIVKNISDPARRGFSDEQQFTIKYKDDNNTINWDKPTNITVSRTGAKNYTGDINATDMPYYIWVGKTNITVNITTDGNLTLSTSTDPWDKTGTWTVTIKQNYEGNSTIEESPAHSYEYIGSVDFKVIKPANVNIRVIALPDKKLAEVKNITGDISGNTQLIWIQVLGETQNKYGKKSELTDDGKVNIEDAIKVSGDTLFKLDEGDYNDTLESTGKWGINVFPTKGSGKINIEVNWPHQGTASEIIDIDKGANVTADKHEVVVNESTPITVTVKNRVGDTVGDANVTLLYKYGNDTVKVIKSITGDEVTAGKGLHGEYKFNLTSKEPCIYIIVRAYYTSGGTTYYAYDKIWSEPDHSLRATVSPTKVLAGCHTTFEVNITDTDGKYVDGDIYIMNKTNLDDFRKHPDMDISLYKIPSPEHKNEGNYTFDYINTTVETKYIYVATTNKWRDSWKNESTSEVEKAIVAVSPDKLCWIVDTNETVTFTVKWNGELLNGTLTLIGVNNTYPDSNRNNTWYGNESLPHYGVIDVTATNGIVKVHNMNATELGNVTFKFTPSEPEEGEKANADGMLKVVLPTVTIEPRIIFLSEENIIKVTVTNPRNGAPCPDLRLWGGFLLEFEKTDENGETTGGVFPISTGNYTLSVGRTLWDGKEVKDAWYKVVVGLKIDAPSETEEEKEITIQVLTRGGKEVSGATVTIGNWTGTTDDEGKVTYKPTKKGDYIITAKKDGYYPSEGASTPLSVKKAPKPPGFEAVALIIGAIVALLLVDHRRKKRRYT